MRVAVGSADRSEKSSLGAQEAVAMARLPWARGGPGREPEFGTQGLVPTGETPRANAGGLTGYCGNSFRPRRTSVRQRTRINLDVTGSDSGGRSRLSASCGAWPQITQHSGPRAWQSTKTHARARARAPLPRHPGVMERRWSLNESIHKLCDLCRVRKQKQNVQVIPQGLFGWCRFPQLPSGQQLIKRLSLVNMKGHTQASWEKKDTIRVELFPWVVLAPSNQQQKCN